MLHAVLLVLDQTPNGNRRALLLLLMCAHPRIRHHDITQYEVRLVEKYTQ